MNYKDTILKKIDWKSNLKVRHDKFNDIRSNIPLDDILDLQAKTAFALGVRAMVEFLISRDKAGDFDEQVTAKMKEWGLE